MDRVRSADRGLLARAGFDFVVIDREHSPLPLDRVCELTFAAQRMGMAALVANVLGASREAGILSGIAADAPAEARAYLAMGYSLVMVSNDATLFGKAAAELVRASHQADV